MIPITKGRQSCAHGPAGLLGWILDRVFGGDPIEDMVLPIALAAGVVLLRGWLDYYRNMVAHRTAAIGRVVGKVLARSKLAKHFEVTIGDDCLEIARLSAPGEGRRRGCLAPPKAHGWAAQGPLAQVSGAEVRWGERRPGREA